MKPSLVDFTYKNDTDESTQLPAQFHHWYKVKCVHYNDGNYYRIRGTINGEVFFDLKDPSQRKFEDMKLLSDSTTPIGNLRNIRIDGKFGIFAYAEDLQFSLSRVGNSLLHNNVSSR